MSKYSLAHTLGADAGKYSSPLVVISTKQFSQVMATLLSHVLCMRVPIASQPDPHIDIIVV